MFDNFDSITYIKYFYYTVFTFCLITGLYYRESKGCNKLFRRYSLLLPFFLSTLLFFYLGLRPLSWYFGDMVMYNHLWNIIDTDTYVINISLKEEWFFAFILRTCKIWVPDAHFWFIIVASFYVLCHYWACKKLLWENVWLALMFVFYSYQFFTFGVNGIRNGMACGLMLLSISFFCDRNTLGYVVGSFLFFLAMGCHRSVVIPMAALIGSIFVIKDIKYAIYIWLGCIVLSLFTGGFFQNFFASLGFDNRMSTYTSASEKTMQSFSNVGFRWDFLLYSAMPVWLTWYVRYKGIYNRTFTVLACTYILANSFWVLVCRVAFSNRFAYLSWFMYALVIAYAVIRVPIWKDQDRKAGQILLAHSAFTIVMYILGK